MLWDAGAVLELQRLTQVHRSAISCCCFSSDGWLLAAGDASGLVSVWDLRHGGLLQLFRWAQRRGAPALLSLKCACLAGWHVHNFHLIPRSGGRHTAPAWHAGLTRDR